MMVSSRTKRSLRELGRKRDKAEKATTDLKEEYVGVIYKQPLVMDVLIFRLTDPPTTSAAGNLTSLNRQHFL